MLTSLRRVLAATRSATGFGDWLRAGARQDTLLPASIPPLLFLLLQPFLCLPPSFPEQKQERLTLPTLPEACPNVQPHGYARSQREGSSTLQTQGQKSLRRWEISRGRSWCPQKGEGNRNFCCCKWKNPKNPKPQQGKKKKKKDDKTLPSQGWCKGGGKHCLSEAFSYLAVF